MQRGRNIHLAALAGALALAAGTMQPAHGAAVAVTTPAAPLLTPGDGAVLVTFNGVLGAAGYNIYSHAAGAAPTLVNAKPDAYTWFNDDGGGKGLKNGTPVFYSVKAVLVDSTGKMSEGPASADGVTVPAPPLFGGLVAYTIGTQNPGSATYDKAKDLITVHTSGSDIWDGSDSGTFVGTKVSGDFTITGKIPAPPTGGEPTYGKIGLMMRSSLDNDAPYAFVFASVHRDNPAEIMLEGHFAAEGTNAASATVFSGGTGGDTTAQKFPVWVRLTRSGTMIDAQQSLDGKTWTETYQAEDFTRLAPDQYVGIGATAHVDDPTMYLDGQIVGSSLTITTP
jgi:regulation of enolase protein 1 (concanavalin A-like superfamily)/predicted lipoprotein with Yx(FWY)xxD motif